MLLKDNRELTKTIEERQERWAEWIQTCFQTTPGKEKPEIMHITEEIWQNIKNESTNTTQIQPQLQK